MCFETVAVCCMFLFSCFLNSSNRRKAVLKDNVWIKVALIFCKKLKISINQEKNKSVKIKVLCVFFFYIFSKEFSPQNQAKTYIDEESGFKNVYILFLFIKQILFIILKLLLLFFSLIHLFFLLFFCDMTNPKISCSVVESQNQKPKYEMEKQQTTNCWNTSFPILNFLNI